MSWYLTSLFLCGILLTPWQVPLASNFLTQDYNATHFASIVSNGSSGTAAAIWRSSDGAFIRIVKHEESIVNLELGPEGNTLLTSSFLPPNELLIKSKDDSIRRWVVSTGKEVVRIQGATCGKFSRDGTRIFGLSTSKHVQNTFQVAAWDSQTGKKLFSVAVPGGVSRHAPITIQESDTSDEILFHHGNHLMLLNSRNGKLRYPVVTLSSGGDSAFLIPGGKEAMIAELRQVSWVDLKSGRQTDHIQFPAVRAWKVAWNRLGIGFAAVSTSGELIYAVRGETAIRATQEKRGSPRSIFLSPDGSYIGVGWGGVNGEPAQTTFHDARDCALAWSSAGHIVGFAGRDNVVVLDGGKLCVRRVFSGRLIGSTYLKDSGSVVLENLN